MNSKTLTLSMKIPLKPGMGIDGLIPFGQRNCRGPKKCQIFRLLNSEDLLSVSQSDPRRRAWHIHTGVHVLLLRKKVTPRRYYPSLRKGMAKLILRDLAATKLPES
jgi:hypothetical protein